MEFLMKYFIQWMYIVTCLVCTRTSYTLFNLELKIRHRARERERERNKCCFSCFEVVNDALEWRPKQCARNRNANTKGREGGRRGCKKRHRRTRRPTSINDAGLCSGQLSNLVCFFYVSVGVRFTLTPMAG